jgi:ATP-dependent Lon protease
MRANKADLLDQPLTSLVRAFGKNVLPDTIELVVQILLPVKNELDRSGHKFSTDLFVASILYSLNEYDDAANLDHAVQNLVNMQKFSTEKKMLLEITASTIRHPGGTEFLKKFTDAIKPLSDGVARRLVHACFLQWRNALDMPKLTDKERVLFGLSLPAKKNAPSLDSIRIGTQYELSDASALATRILKPVRSQTDKTTYEFAHSLFAAASLCTLHEARNPGMDEVLKFAVDPNWDCAKQIFSHVGVNGVGGKGARPKTRAWAKAFCDTSCAMPDNVSNSLVKRSHALWTQALGFTDGTAKTATPAVSVEPLNSVQIFSPSALAAATTLLDEMREERKGGGDRLLKAALENNGYRTLPDLKNACAVLEKAKGQFENLITPISYLQKNLVLSAAMGAKSFRVRPILLLGDPGIGKTYLAMALAGSLGGSMEKVSAGGAGFLLNGSQSTWTGAKHGQVFKALAEGSTTSPVFIVDEIDKMGEDERYPILPVLLELLEPGTAAVFKDEFFEMDFDASRIIFILTANSLNNVPEALLSRVEVFDVQRPEPDQRLRIIEAELKELRAQTGKRIRFDKTSSRKLADRTDIDMRRTTSIIRDAFVEAIMKDEKVAQIVMPEGGKRNGGCGNPYNGTSVGFLTER